MANEIRGVHVSPGVYTKETELSYAVTSLGITTLGVAGETLKGPAFQPVSVKDWADFKSKFGGTSPEKYKGSKYPKYELPYIAKSYLSESKQLDVVRVLGLSGYNAGPAWLITASKGEGSDKYVVAVIRSRGNYEKYSGISSLTGKDDECVCPSHKYDRLVYLVGETVITGSASCVPLKYNRNVLKVKDYENSNLNIVCNSAEIVSGESGSGFTISNNNLGKFVIYGKQGTEDYGYDVDVSGANFNYVVSLNSYDKDYILNVLGTNPNDGDAPVYVESLYDIALEQLIAAGEVDQLDKDLTFFKPSIVSDYCGLNPVNGVATVATDALTKRYVGMRFLCTEKPKNDKEDMYAYVYNYKTGKPMTVEEVERINGTEPSETPSTSAPDPTPNPDQTDPAPTTSQSTASPTQSAETSSGANETTSGDESVTNSVTNNVGSLRTTTSGTVKKSGSTK